MEKVTANIRSPSVTAHAHRATLNDGVAYDGAYEVTPNTSEQALETQNKRMKENVTVHAVPFFEVSNPSGTTVIIGSC